jgi:hypothetical protein
MGVSAFRQYDQEKISEDARAARKVPSHNRRVYLDFPEFLIDLSDWLNYRNITKRQTE